MFCPMCGSEAPKGARTCPACGAALDARREGASPKGDEVLAHEAPAPAQPPVEQAARQQPQQYGPPAAPPQYAPPKGAPVPPPPGSPAAPPARPGNAPAGRKRAKVVVIGVVAAAVVLCLAGALAFIAPEMGRSSAYGEAAALLQDASYAEALEKYEGLGDYRDAQQQATLCRKHLAYGEAVALMDAGDYEAARDAFTEILGFQDASERAEECGSIVEYAAAESLLGEGKYADAYEAFSALGGYGDAADRAASCIQEAPRTGELYHDPGFSGSSSELAVTAAAGAGDLYFVKVYQGDALVSSIFFADGEAVTIGLPAGTYYLNVANGSDWFGEADLFGASGTYGRLKIEDGSADLVLEAGYRYDLSISMSFFFGSSEAVDRSAF